jgi:hypothetical protein
VGDKLLGDGGGLGEVAGFQLHGHPPDSAVAVSGVVRITDQPRQRCGDSVVAACLLSVQHVSDPAPQDLGVECLTIG